MTRSEAAKIINDQWIYSMHWPEVGWEVEALKNAKERLEYVARDYNRLRNAISELKDQVNDLRD